ncbi:hypothetical protein HYH03_018431 [Edaphochlamys debaryana]|uniref:Guanylate kinase 1 n=1 Tax=Edaphochlamys debaryana TaxID=47281 RepID=A0A835XEN0_9CHLO|nr:hypothetical protein HYH03_018431 [Edaphochlamys debaryana]|eukprot:KAG2482658.1 hypothetical protein HYH03_018431 [Edaphochlamys debaryana]
MDRATVVFVLGAPGSGKGTQCANIVEKYGWTHLSTGDLLRAEVAAGSPLGQEVDAIMKAGEMVPNDVILNLVANAMNNSGATRFLVDGFPRTLDQLMDFQESIKPCDGVIIFSVPEEVAVERLVARGATSGRADDNPDTIRARMEVFAAESQPVIEFLADAGSNVIEVDASGPPEDVFEQVADFMEDMDEAAADREAGVIPEDKSGIVTSSLGPGPIAEADEPGAEDSLVVFVLGSPGAGKGTQCSLLAERYGWTHLSTGELLREEVDAGTEIGNEASAIMAAGDMVPTRMVLDLLETAMAATPPDRRRFLVDGFPRKLEQLEEFEVRIKPCDGVLVFSVPEEVAIERLVARGATSGRDDDNVQTIRARMEVFRAESQPVIDLLREQGANVAEIDASGDVEDIYVEAAKFMDVYGPPLEPRPKQEQPGPEDEEAEADGPQQPQAPTEDGAEAEPPAGEEAGEPAAAEGEKAEGEGEGEAPPPEGEEPGPAEGDQAPAEGEGEGEAAAPGGLDGYSEDQIQAALRIQAAGRGYLDRKKVAEMRAAKAAGEPQLEADSEQQAAEEGAQEPEPAADGEAEATQAEGEEPAAEEAPPGDFSEEELKAALRIQAAGRGYIERKKVAAMRAAKEAEEAGGQEGGEEAEQPAEGEQGEESPTVMRTAPSGLTDYSEDQIQAALRIQAAGRGYLDRKKVAEMRAAKAAEETAAEEGQGEGGEGEPQPEAEAEAAAQAEAEQEEQPAVEKQASIRSQAEKQESIRSQAEKQESIRSQAEKQESIRSQAEKQESIRSQAEKQASLRESVEKQGSVKAGSRSVSRQPSQQGEPPAEEARKLSTSGLEAVEEAGEPGPEAQAEGVEQEQAPPEAEASGMDDLSAEQMQAALLIQAAGRGYIERKKVAAMKAAKEAEEAGGQEGGEEAEPAAEGEAEQAAEADDEDLQARIEEEVASIRAMLVVCGPSGVGKGTLIGRLMSEHPDKFGFSVSHTTRGPRPGEVDGVHYRFSEKATMQREVAAGLFLEHAEVHGNMYGTSLAAVADVGRSGKVAVLDIDVQGAANVKASAAAPKARFVFIDPPSAEALEARLRGRGTETEDKVQLRLANANSEIEMSREPGFFHARVINDDFDVAYYQLKETIEALIPGTFTASELRPPLHTPDAGAAVPRTPELAASAEEGAEEADAGDEAEAAAEGLEEGGEEEEGEALVDGAGQVEKQASIRSQAEKQASIRSQAEKQESIRSQAERQASLRESVEKQPSLRESVEKQGSVKAASRSVSRQPSQQGEPPAPAVDRQSSSSVRPSSQPAAPPPASPRPPSQRSDHASPSPRPPSVTARPPSNLGARAPSLTSAPPPPPPPPIDDSPSPVHAARSVMPSFTASASASARTSGAVGASAPAYGSGGGNMSELTVRQYMDRTVIPALRDGLRSLNETRPDDPLKYLADYIMEARANGGRHPQARGSAAPGGRLF